MPCSQILDKVGSKGGSLKIIRRLSRQGWRQMVWKLGLFIQAEATEFVS